MSNESYVIYVLRDPYLPDTQGLGRPEVLTDYRGRVVEFGDLQRAYDYVNRLASEPYKLLYGEASRPIYAILDKSDHDYYTNNTDNIINCKTVLEECQNPTDGKPCMECQNCKEEINSQLWFWIGDKALYKA